MQKTALCYRSFLMSIVFYTALGVGGATVIGALIGFLFKDISHRIGDAILAFAAGVMLAASVMGLIIPSLEGGGKYALFVTVLGIFTGALVVTFIDKLVPHLHSMTGTDIESHPDSAKNLSSVLLFVIAIGIHNLPEGIAAGVGFGSGDISEALTIAVGIALQNIPEGMVIIAPMIAAGISKGKTLFIASLTGLVEVIGTFIGYFAITISTAILPFALAFAGGTMLYVVSDEMLAETHNGGNERVSTYSLILGFCVMLATDFYLG